MKSTLVYSLTYQLCFAILSLSTIWVIEGNGGELFAGIFWSNVIYTVAAFPINLVAFFVIRRLFAGRHILLCVTSIAISVFVLNSVFYYLDRSFVTLNLFIGSGTPFNVSLFAHLFLLISALASLYSAELIKTSENS